MKKFAKFLISREVGSYEHFKEFNSFGKKVKDFVKQKTNQEFTTKKRQVPHAGAVYYMRHRDGNIVAMYSVQTGVLDINKKYLLKK